MKKLVTIVGGLLVVVAGLTSRAAAGTQDFTLVNKTGVDIHNLFVSETAKDDWEDDVLGEEVLENGNSVEVSFEGKSSCIWDMMVKDEQGGGVFWRKIDLCKASEVTLTCSGKTCSASIK